MNPLYEQMQTSVFERMSGLAAKHGAINLGQGFPDFGWPDEILDSAARALTEGSNQYAPSRGLPQLREAVAAHYNRHHGLNLDASHVCVTSGATEAIGAAILATISPGDEVIIFTPAYDCYAPMIRRGGGVVREVALKPPALAGRARGDRGGDQRQDARHHLQQPAQPDRTAVRAGRAGDDRGNRPRA